MTGLSQHLDAARRSVRADVATFNFALRFLAVATLVIMASALSACEKAADVRYRVAVEIDTPEGLRSGSSVWSFQLSEAEVPLASKYNARLKGEAVAVDLPDGRTLFALLRDRNGADMMGMLPERHFDDIISPTYSEDRTAHMKQRADRVAYLHQIADHAGERRTIPCENRTEEDPRRDVDPAFDCPMLVTFADIADPTSVELVDPDDLAATFGEGYALKRITVQITDDPVTTGVEDRLGWVGQMFEHDYSTDGPFFETYATELQWLIRR